ncbi:hypothetical protein ACFRCG_03360 [Embleya sp. NPDC056575]|uniref:hypothetical protein n=1 Tax=unclassified Embleya TaxID=2699296 RepID=UPI00368C575B
MTRPLILDRALTAPADAVRPLPEHHFDPDLAVNVTADGVLLIHAVDPSLVADYAGAQEPKGIKTDD